MLFFLNLDGTVTRSDTDHVYQGQNKVANVELFTLISPAQAAIQVAFTLPNGLTTTYAPMSYVGAYSVDESNQKQVHRWKLAVPYNVTEVEGQVGVSFNVLLNDGTSGQTQETINQTTYTSSFIVEYSALPIPPTTATESELEQLLELLNLYYTQNASLAAKQPFVVGTVTTNTLDANQQASVAVEQSAVADGNGNYPTNFDFGIPQGTTFTPSVDDNGNISWSNDGGKANPVTKNIKGAQGQTGATPDIEMQATVDANVGTPSVAVEKSGTAENPKFTLAFSNIKGETGADGNHITISEFNHKFISLGIIEVGGTYRDVNDWFFVLGTYTGDDNKTYQQLAGCKVIEKGSTTSKARVMSILDLPLPKDGTDGKDGLPALVSNGLWGSMSVGIFTATNDSFNRLPKVNDKVVLFSSQNQYAIATVKSVGETLSQIEIEQVISTRGATGPAGTTVYNNLSDIPVINQDLTASGFTPVANTYYRHTGATTEAFMQGIIYLYDTAYHKLGESGGTTLNMYTYSGNDTTLVNKIMTNSKLSYIKQSIENVPCALLVVADTYNRANGTVARPNGIFSVAFTYISGSLKMRTTSLVNTDNVLSLTSHEVSVSYVNIIYFNDTEII